MGSSGYLIAGLGNPGSKYTNTRHNIGFSYLEHMVDDLGLHLGNEKFNGRYCRGKLSGKQVLFVEPQTYMNLSGECIRRFIDFFKIDIDNILILHDDIDLNTGRIKVVARGGAGGHNGIRSVGKHLGTNDFARIKIGIGRPQEHGDGHSQPVEKFVLSKFRDDEMKLFEQQADLAFQAAKIFIKHGVEDCMNRINGQGISI